MLNGSPRRQSTLPGSRAPHHDPHASAHAAAVPIIAEQMRSDRPALGNGVPWEHRPITDPNLASTQIFGICSVSYDALRRVDYALRVTLLVALPLAILSYNDATESAIVAPGIALIIGVVVPQPRVGSSVAVCQRALAALAIQQALSYAYYAINPNRHVVFWFFIYIISTLVIAFLTEGTVTKLSLYFMNIILVTEYHDSFPHGMSPYRFAGEFAASVLIGAAFGVFAPMFPYPRTNRDDAAVALKAMYNSIAICFAGLSSSFIIPNEHNAVVQRRVALRRITAAREALNVQHGRLRDAMAEMRFEIHRSATLERLQSRLAVASLVASSLDGLIAMLTTLARDPAKVDDSDIAQDWHHRMRPSLTIVCDYVDEVCNKAGNIDYAMTKEDVDRMDRVRHSVREAFERARFHFVRSAIQSGATSPLRRLPSGALPNYEMSDVSRIIEAAEASGSGPGADNTSGSPPLPDPPDLAHTADPLASPAFPLTAPARAGAGASARDSGSGNGFPNAHGIGPTMPVVGGSDISNFPFLIIGYFTACHGRLLRVLAALPVDEELHGGGHDDDPAASETTVAEPAASSEPIHETATATSSDAAAARGGAALPNSASQGIFAPHHRDEHSGSNHGDADDDDAPAELKDSIFAEHMRRHGAASAFALPHTHVAVELVEPVLVRALLYWPRSLLDAGRRVVKLVQRDKATLLKLREAVKLSFAMTTALIITLLFGTRLPANGAATIAFVKDANAASTMLASFDYIAATITGSVYGYVVVTVSETQTQLIAFMCVIVVVLSYVRSHSRYTSAALLASFFALSIIAPGKRDEGRLLTTVQYNVLCMTWLVLTHAFLWPVWPSTTLNAELHAAVEMLRSLVSDLLRAIESTDPANATALCNDIVDRRAAFRDAIEHLRATINLAAREPSLRSRPYPEREQQRLVDGLESVASLIFPVASSTRYLNELPPHPRGGDFVPFAVLKRLRQDTRIAAVQLDVFMRGVSSLWQTDVDITATLLQAHADGVAVLDRCIVAGTRSYFRHLSESFDARPYEMPAINSIMHFYATLPPQLDYLLEASIDARRAVQMYRA